jgi:uncharacterized protein (TIGR02231 family)
VKIVNVDLERAELDKPQTESAHPRAEELTRLQAEIRKLEARKAALGSGGEFLQSVKVRMKEDAAGLATSATPDTGGLRTALGFLLEEFGANHEAKAEIERAIVETRETIQSIEREISSKSAVARDRFEWTATMELLAESSAEVALALDYSVTGAGWTREYDVFVSDDLEELELVYGAEVSQRTGEDWSDVRIQLSCAEPALGAQMPELSAWWLNVPELQVASTPQAQPDKAGEMPVSDAFAGIEAIGIPEVVMSARAAVASTIFEVPARQRLPSDGRARRVRISPPSPSRVKSLMRACPSSPLTPAWSPRSRTTPSFRSSLVRRASSSEASPSERVESEASLPARSSLFRSESIARSKSSARP